ncbi:MAG: HD domain-containing protein [Planctomycetota bacterium]
MTTSSIIERIRATFAARGDEKYADEGVTQLQHALQCAELARREAADSQLVVAALLHDIGHILGASDLPHSCNQNLDDHHEDRGYAFLHQHFGDAVADPVRLHVAAKRYLCTVDPSYAERLSPTSYKSFLDQGGMMSPEEVEDFRREPHFEAAVRLRKWDDTGKNPAGQEVVIEDFLDELASVCTPAQIRGQDSQSSA